MVKNPFSMESRPQRKQQELPRKRGLAIFFLILLFALFSLGSTDAQDRAQESISLTNTAGTSNPCRFALALPEMEGPLTLGIFSREAKLVRLLYCDTPIDSIPAGLNGLLISWDGKDDAGLAVPDGIYNARGLIHGKLAVSAFPRNDDVWYDFRLQETNDSPLCCDLCFIRSPFPKNRIVVMAARDALLQRRPLLTITATIHQDVASVTAEGLPIFSIPLNTASFNNIKPDMELHYGKNEGTAELSIKSAGGSSTYLLSGLDQLVPLDAGALPMPPGKLFP